MSLADAQDADRPRAVLLWVQFDGTDFHGFQRQQGHVRTVAGVLEQVWLDWLGEAIVARTSSRTDAGVHARRMPVLVRTGTQVPARGLMLGLAERLPEDLAVLDALDLPRDFDERQDAVGKRYIYRLTLGPVRRPLYRRLAWHVKGPLDLAAMQAAARRLEGVHDFAAFRSVHCQAATTVRELLSVAVVPGSEEAGEPWTLTLCGNAFLHHMARIVAGTLVDVGRGRRSLAEVERALVTGDRTQAGQTAPAQGLTLDEVFYGPPGARQGQQYKALLKHFRQAGGDPSGGDNLAR
jgi:tRNA pseudouridine38-40 synthase